MDQRMVLRDTALSWSVSTLRCHCGICMGSDSLKMLPSHARFSCCEYDVVKRMSDCVAQLAQGP